MYYIIGLLFVPCVYIMYILQIPRLVSMTILIALELFVSFFIANGEFMAIICLLTIIIFLIPTSGLKSPLRNVPFWFNGTWPYDPPKWATSRNAKIMLSVCLAVFLILIGYLWIIFM